MKIIRSWPRMGVAVAVWACSLPFVFLISVPRLGVSTVIAVALVLLVGISLVCEVLGVSRRPPGSSAANDETDVKVRRRMPSSSGKGEPS